MKNRTQMTVAKMIRLLPAALLLVGGLLVLPDHRVQASNPYPYTIWGASATPENSSANDSGAVELGVKFRSDVSANVTGVRFYKGTANTGEHIGNLWSMDGTRLATATFGSETPSGWQQVNFTTPAPINAGQTYIASYHTNTGHYSTNLVYFQSTGVDNPPLHALASGVDGANGVYTYGGTSAFPSSSYRDGNYWVDVVLTATLTAPPTVNIRFPSPGATNVALNTPVKAILSEEVVPTGFSFTLTDPASNPVAGRVTWELQHPDRFERVATFQPNFPLQPNATYTATFSGAVDRAGNPQTAPVSWSFTTTPVAIPPPSTAGNWAPPMSWPIVSIHSAVVNTGKVLQWDEQLPVTYSRVWDPASGTFVTATFPGYSTWCAGMVHTADGRLLQIGGDQNDQPANAFAGAFDPATNTWTRLPDLNLPRWYPGTVRLTDGRIVIISGGIIDAQTWADTPEIYDPATNAFTLLTGVNTSDIHEELYPPSFLLPDGRIFVYAASTGASRLLDVTARTWTPGPTSPFLNGSLAMYKPGVFLLSGGGPSYQQPSQNQAAVLDMTASSPAWRSVAPMSFARSYHNLVDLPDGRVLAVGGSAYVTTSSTVGAFPSEIWNPVTETWSGALSSLHDPRMNHSAVVLMPDATVLASGGGHETASGADDFYTAEIYSPSYLFQGGTRPGITSAPASGGYGGNITITTPDAASISTVSLLGLGADTHMYNSDQRFINLAFTAGSGSLTATIPSNANVAPAGDYMLFVVNSSGVPSVSRMIHLSSTDSTPPTVAAAVPASGATGVSVTSTVSATFSKPVQPATIGFVVKDPANNPVPGSTSYNASTRTTTFTPTSALAFSTVYTATVSGARDLNGNQMVPYSWSFTTQPPPSCPCQIWPSGTVPGTTAVSDPGPLELGVKFRSETAGSITGIRFYKGSGNGGSHQGSLWATDGTLLGSVTFGSETPGGWQQASFTSPVNISAGTTYIASYYTTQGHYAYDPQYFNTSGQDNAPLHALRAGVDGGDGVFKYGPQSAFPSDPSPNNANYWVDVVFSSTIDTTPPSVISTQPALGATQVAINVAPAATFSKPVQPATVSFVLKDQAGQPVAGSTSYDAAHATSIFTPNAPLAYSTTYTATVSGARDLNGNQMTSPYMWSFTTAPPPTCPCQIWPASSIPANPAAPDSGSLELGVKFRSDQAGSIAGIRFYKGAGNGGSHIGNFWSGTGTLLASATFSSETPSGWQQVTFASPVPITANTTYVASYFAPNGHYAYDAGYFTAGGRDAPPLHALKAGVDGPNAVFKYGTQSAYPSDGSGASDNYWVDVVFVTTVDTTPPSVTGTQPANGATSVPINATPMATFSKAVQPATISFVLKDPLNNPVAGNVGYNGGTNTATFTPSANLGYGKTYTATVSGARDLSGIQMTAPYTWSFTTLACPCSLWSAATTPSVAAVSDPGAVELGVKFRADVNGQVTGVRFYKGAGNTGQHVGSVWSTTGTRLATANFGSETDTGWQQVTFGTPLAVTAGTTYIVSYYAPNGHYAYDSGYFATQGRDNPPLHALKAGVDGPDGVFKYGPASSFPSDFNNNSNANYWVDVVFTPS